MTPLVPKQSLNKMTWGDLLPLLSSLYSVAVEETVAEIPSSDGQSIKRKFLIRRAGDEVYTFPLPLNHASDAKVGVWTVESICRRLNVPFKFPDWPVIL